MKPTVWHANDSYSYHPRRKRQQRIDVMAWARSVPPLLPELGERDERDDGKPIGALLVALPLGLLLWACVMIGGYATLQWLAK